MNEKPLVSIIILNYNGGELLIECIKSILKSKYENIEIIVVDNSSNDGSQIKCKEKFKDIVLIQNKKNLGYCGGNNEGIRSANGDYLIILNPDVVVEPEWISEMIISFHKYGPGFYQPKILSNKDHEIIISAGNQIQIFGFGYSRGKGVTDIGQYEKDEEISYASGTCLFTTSEIFRKVGYFDPYLFAYHDDLDLCWRGQLLGIKSFYVHKAIIYHPLEGYSFKWNSFKFFLMERNRIYCLLKNYSFKSIVKMIPSLLLIEIAVTIFYLKKGFLIAKIKANLDILKNLKLVLKNHKNIQSNRKKQDYELIKIFSEDIEIPKWVLPKNDNTKLSKIIKIISKLSKKNFKNY